MVSAPAGQAMIRNKGFMAIAALVAVYAVIYLHHVFAAMTPLAAKVSCFAASSSVICMSMGPLLFVAYCATVPDGQEGAVGPAAQEEGLPIDLGGAPGDWSYYLCGLKQMVAVIVAGMTKQAVAMQRIRKEEFEFR